MATIAKKENYVTLSLDEYNALRDKYNELSIQNEELENCLNIVEEAEGQKVITKTFYEDELVKVEVKDFDEVQADVEKEFKVLIENLEKQIEQLEQNVENQNQTADALAKKALGFEMEIARLKNRSLWQRIRNK